MQTNWAEENLQTIRTLMERSAVYRRALAPIAIFAGIMGVAGALVGYFFHLDTGREFCGFWLGTAFVVVIGALLIARRQAFKAGEMFWSPPTRRVAQALLPPLVVGMVVGMLFWRSKGSGFNFILPFTWALFYGCALHSAGFFISRGVKWLGWGYILSTFGIIFCLSIASAYNLILDLNPHFLMGFFFGALHLLYGAYLYLTEKGKNAA
ncbi:MAG TPA: hypothetical protein VNU95_06655 [Candidatus Acidoferrales bacterium]|jgi:hypothetical protein|nr:hypothetical protein [Candidatus Acidoferrales bacterium]